VVRWDTVPGTGKSCYSHMRIMRRGEITTVAARPGSNEWCTKSADTNSDSQRRSWGVTLLRGKSERESINIRNELGGLSSNRSDQARITIRYSDATNIRGRDIERVKQSPTMSLNQCMS